MFVAVYARAVDWAERVTKLRRWTRGGERAPHKPLLLLYALGHFQRCGNEPILFSEAEDQLGRLLREFGPPRKTSPAYPFHHLASDGLWVVTTAEGSGGSTASPGQLRARQAAGQLTPDLAWSLRSDPQLLPQWPASCWTRTSSRRYTTTSAPKRDSPWKPPRSQGSRMGGRPGGAATPPSGLRSWSPMSTSARSADMTAGWTGRWSAWTPHTCDGGRSAGPMKSPTGCVCARCTTSCLTRASWESPGSSGWLSQRTSWAAARPPSRSSSP